jgi:hypothetical protein
MQRIDFNKDWKFAKEGEELNPVILPHDAMIHEQRDPKSTGGSGIAYFPGGKYIYEKAFQVPEGWANKHIVLQFEGVYRNAKVMVNGVEAGGRPYGYIPFFIDMDNFLRYGEDNSVRVEADNLKVPNSRWYSGAGIYRPVWLYISDNAYIEPEGVRITTISYKPPKIHIDVAHHGGEVQFEILDGDKCLMQGSGDCVDIELPNAKLWSDEAPNLYNCHVILMKNGTAVDEWTESFGIRTIEWSNKGLFINGNETLLRGGCIHHDNGILGACSWPKSEERRVRILKENGYNAIRSAHNPPSPAMLDACDKYGMYVIDEMWDMWYQHKTKYDYASDFESCYKDDIQAVVSRDYNHSSIIMYSIGNEVGEPAEEKGLELERKLVKIFHSLDKSRPVTAGINLMILYMASKEKSVFNEEGENPADKQASSASKFNSTMFNMMVSRMGRLMNSFTKRSSVDKVTTPCLDALDIAGYNYASGRYPIEGQKHPDRIIFGSETFPQDIARNWIMVKKYPYLVGDFMWTAWDYIGEVGIGAWAYTPDAKTFSKPYPWLLADAGAIDILGNPGAEAAYAATVWGQRDKPYIGVQPVNHPKSSLIKAMWRGTNAIESWSWKNCDGNPVVVEVYSNQTSVELFLNGSSMGKKKVKDCKAVYEIKYEAGVLMAVAYNAAGNETGKAQLASSSGNLRLRVIPEETVVRYGDIVYFDIALVGDNGIVESNDDRRLTAHVDGGTLLGFGSANPRTEERYDTGNFTTYYGRAQAVVLANGDDMISLTVTGDGLNEETVSVSVDSFI